MDFEEFEGLFGHKHLLKMLLSLPAVHIIFFSMMTALQTTLATSRPESAPRWKYIQAPYSTKAIVNTEIVDLVRINYWAQKQCWEVRYFNFNQLNNNLFIDNNIELFIINNDNYKKKSQVVTPLGSSSCWREKAKVVWSGNRIKMNWVTLIESWKKSELLSPSLMVSVSNTSLTRQGKIWVGWERSQDGEVSSGGARAGCREELIWTFRCFVIIYGCR